MTTWLGAFDGAHNSWLTTAISIMGISSGLWTLSLANSFEAEPLTAL